MKIYQAYNLRIVSELQMPELIESEGEPDVIVRFDHVDNASVMEDDRGNFFVGKMPEIADFCIKNGSEIIIDPFPGVDEGLLRAMILGPVLCVLLRQRGFLVLHASAVNIRGKAIAFIGGPGWGKSTLATAFHTHGYDVLTDDVMPIKVGLGEPLVFPAYPQFKIWREAATSLGHNVENFSPIFKNAPKLSYKFSHGFQETPLPLHRIYILDKGEEHKISSVAVQEAFVEILRHSRATSLVTHQKFVAEHFKLSTELIQQVSFRRFTRKPCLEDLPELVKMIENDVVGINNYVSS
ncbi:hypothetical protein [Calothrix sp. PCC 6303]|uniref:hypothetical protein n=1 Tax=Calothrix sp. PCC 6303 TaxID=1170562 RepID=UPI0002A03845|nr:hypothetical protein [Calothrix sp. PCC 6303]AFZ00991.1 hypothetical protein Cal6303_1957 [Calothrix sp. PCC 6303]